MSQQRYIVRFPAPFLKSIGASIPPHITVHYSSWNRFYIRDIDEGTILTLKLKFNDSEIVYIKM